MKEQIYTIPLMDAFNAGDECPFCFIERNLEQHAMDFVLGAGASYMEDDIRAETDKAGFCREHYKKMFEYGNRLGCGLILTTHFKKKNEELSGLVNRCITDTLTRSIYTNATTFIMLAVLYVLGVSSIKEFAMPLMVGVLGGTFSSICITGPLWYLMKTKFVKKK